MASIRGLEIRLSPVKTASKSSERSAASHMATRSRGSPAPITTPRLGTLRPTRIDIADASVAARPDACQASFHPASVTPGSPTDSATQGTLRLEILTGRLPVL